MCNLKNIIIFVLAVLLLISCAMQVAMVSEEEDLMAKAMEPPEGKALVYIIRPSNLGKPFKFEVNCDGVYIGGTAGMLYIYVIVDPGNHLFVGIAENTSELEISAEAGKIYYIRQRPMIGLFNPVGAVAAFAGSAAAFFAAGVVRSLQQGGIVGEGYGGGDKRIIAAEEGEMVIRKEVVRTNRSALEAMNAGEQGMMTINVYLGIKKIQSEITHMIRNKQISVYTGALTNR